ncbi:CpaF family protein [Vibrio paucivorans]
MQDYIRLLYNKFRNNIYDGLNTEEVSRFTPDELKQEIGKAIRVLSNKTGTQTTSSVRDTLSEIFVSEIVGLGPLEEYITDPTVSDIMVNGYKQIYVERAGEIYLTESQFMSSQQLLEVAKRIAGKVNRTIDESHPMVDARLEDGSRINIVVAPISIDGTQLSIRKFHKDKVDLKSLVFSGMLNEKLARVLAVATRSKLNIIISGGTGSGKTTLLNALSGYIGEKERIITIEDAAELSLQQKHVVRMETKIKTAESNFSYGIKELLINSLRMRPDRILIGECRGAEAFEMLQAMNTGHSGSMSTIHANSVYDALARLESMVMMSNLNFPIEVIRKNIVSAIDLVIQIERFPNGKRRVIGVSEVKGIEGNVIIFDDLYDYNNGDEKNNKISNHSALYHKSRKYSLEKELSNYGT